MAFELTLRRIGLGLLVAGLALAFVADKAAVTVALLTLGTCLFAFHELLPRLEGKVEIGPKGFTATLASSRVADVSASQKPPPPSSEVAVIKVPKLQIKSASKVAEISAVGNPGFVPVPLIEGDSLNLTMRYKTEEGQQFQIEIPVEFKEAKSA